MTKREGETLEDITLLDEMCLDSGELVEDSFLWAKKRERERERNIPNNKLIDLSLHPSAIFSSPHFLGAFRKEKKLWCVNVIGVFGLDIALYRSGGMSSELQDSMSALDGPQWVFSNSNGAKTNEEGDWGHICFVYHFCLFVLCLFMCLSGLYELYFDGHSDQQYKHVIYIYAFSRRFYPKRLTLHLSYNF